MNGGWSHRKPGLTVLPSAGLTPGAIPFLNYPEQGTNTASPTGFAPCDSALETPNPGKDRVGAQGMKEWWNDGMLEIGNRKLEIGMMELWNIGHPKLFIFENESGLQKIS
jgi:hypothetical protein